MYFIGIALLLLAGYSVLLAVESMRGVRYFAPYRARLDKTIAQGEFIIEHVDLGSFAREEVRRGTLYLTHASAHFVLQAVRSVERFLTHIVRRLRLHPEAPRPGGESARHFVRTLSEFKVELETTRPEVPEVR